MREDGHNPPPRMRAATGSARRWLVRLTEPLEDLGYDMWVVAHRDARALPRVRHVMDQLEALAKEELPLPR